MKQVQRFWKWFKANEEFLKNAFVLGIDTEEALFELGKKCDMVSKRICLSITTPKDPTQKIKITFSAGGYPKLFAKIRALEEQAPELDYFLAQAFIKPLEDRTAIKEGKDCGFNFGYYTIRISEVRMSLIDYNLPRKQLTLLLHLPNLDEMVVHDNFKSHLYLIVMKVIGEIAFKKHIKYVEYTALDAASMKLPGLIDLPDCIDRLYTRKKNWSV